MKTATKSLTVFTMCGLLTAQVAAQKPIIEELFTVHSSAPPSTIGEMTAAASAVIIATYAGQSRLIDSTHGTSAPRLRLSAHRFRIERIVKLHHYLPFAGNDAEYAMRGGDREYATHISRERNEHHDILVAGHTYVLFLATHELTGELGIAWGGAGLFDITNHRIFAIDRRVRHYDGPAAPFLTALEAAAIGARQGPGSEGRVLR
jgi:hypothetical protein